MTKEEIEEIKLAGIKDKLRASIEYNLVDVEKFCRDIRRHIERNFEKCIGDIKKRLEDTEQLYEELKKYEN